MLRFKPTRVSLTEDDLCYHIDSIFSRNDQLTKWHRQRTGSGDSYDGDDDEDGLFLNSDTFSVPETLFESECDETQSQTPVDDTVQETLGEGNTNIVVPSRRLRPLSVRFASPEPPPSSPDSDSQVVVRSEQAVHNAQLRAEQSAGSSHSLPLAIQLALLSSTDWNRVRGAFPSQHNHPNPRLLVLPSSRQSRPTEAALDPSVAGILSSITAFPVRISSGESAAGQSESFRNPSLSLCRLTHDVWMSLKVKPSPTIKPLDPPSNHLPNIQLIPWEVAPATPKMKHTPRTESTPIVREPQEPRPSDVHTPEAMAQECLAEGTRISGSPALHSSPEGSEYRSIKKRSSSPAEVVSTVQGTPYAAKLMITEDIKSSRDKYSKDVLPFAYCDTVSRATQTDPDLASSMENGPADNLLNNLRRQENIAPSGTAEQSLSQAPRHDPFMSAMFPERDAPVYDPTTQIRRSIQGYVNPQARRGRTARDERGVVRWAPNMFIG
ncbi:hypothetical protein BDW62DRAFT_208083 [Aspergillus aurantiobrunneus]